ncbi:amidase [Heyndrickxia ginsengihumi]|uniref:amidase n=1 Tax=Heyndrickxia ginsengihumi TaxID=363870 RepID=UPI003D1F705E
MDEISYLSYDPVGLAQLLKKKEISAQEVVEVAFQRLEKVNKQLNAVIRTRKEKVLDEIQSLNVMEQPFAGVPILLKDISQTIKGEPMTNGSKLFMKNRAAKDSNFVATLRKTGFLFLGHTNVPEFGLKNITEPEIYGAAKNPWNECYSPGGSSGGAAASVAAGIVPLAGGNDGGGSIRIPASFTSLVGLKPTRGRTPVGPGVGRQWQGASIDFILSRTVRDSAALLDYLQTIQPEAAFQTPLYNGSFFNDVQHHDKQRFRIAFSTKSPVGTPVSEEAKAAVYQTVKWLEAEGHIVEEKENGVNGVRLMENYYLMNAGEMAAMFLSLEKMLGRSLTYDDMEIVSWVLYKAGERVSAAEFALSIEEWDIAAMQMASFHQTYDLFLTPTTAFPAPKIGELMQTEQDIEKLMNIEKLSSLEQQQLIYDMFEPSLTFTPFTQLANLTGQPAISVPVHKTKNGLPLGVQFIAPKGRENWLLNLAHDIEQSDLWIGMQGNPYFDK